MKAIHCWKTVTLASLSRRKPKEIHQTVTLSGERDVDMVWHIQ